MALKHVAPSLVQVLVHVDVVETHWDVDFRLDLQHDDLVHVDVVETHWDVDFRLDLQHDDHGRFDLMT